MCGIFGSVRALDSDAQRAGELVWHLGAWSEERGTDAAGLAVATGADHGPPPPDAAVLPEAGAHRWRIVRHTGLFRDLWDPDLLVDVHRADAILGHSRAATQGAPDRLVNASPMVVDGYLGTHNGDIDALGLRLSQTLPTPAPGDTDSAVLLQALAGVGDDATAIRQLLGAVRGRAALAWSRTRRDDLVWLARAGLSPLAVARDNQGSLFWASNPAWLVAAARAVGATLTEPPLLLPEGTLLAIARPDGRLPRFVGNWRFRPTVRPEDLERVDAVWRGFDADTVRRDRAALVHRVAADTAAMPTAAVAA